MRIDDNIKRKIFVIRGYRIILDSDLSRLYQVETKRINEKVKRNIKRFPSDFMFQLTKKEITNLMTQNATSSSSWGGRRKLPYAFTEQGIATLSGILNSDKAIGVNINIMRAFVSMRKYLASHGQIFQRLDHVEKKQFEHENKFDRVFNAIESKDIRTKQGIFYDGQIFDAYNFVSKLIKSANKSIILIDNYVDESVLIHFSKRKRKVKVKILTRKISDQLKLDVKKFNKQYPKIEIKKNTKFHDRFLIIDSMKVYHFGASLKDLGNKCFGFSLFDKNIFNGIFDLFS
jgi:hypothetical protein